MINTGERAGMSGVFQASKFDVANRRTEFTSRTRQRSGRYSYIYTNRSTLQSYDGDGHALKQQEQLNNTPLAGTEKYQIWSSVLQSYLSEYGYGGKKSKVFAGGAVIAEQTRQLDINGNLVEQVVWIHADPVSGSSEYVGKTGAKWYRKEYEPLGNQEVSVFGLEEEFPQPQHLQLESQARAEDPQWQCSQMYTPELSWTVPTRCGLAALANLDGFLGGSESENSPSHIQNDAPGPKTPEDTTGEEMPVNPTPTDKPQGSPGTQGAVAPSSVGAPGNDEGTCEYDAEGKPTCMVNVMDNSVSGFVSAEFSRDAQDLVRNSIKDARGYLETNKDCEEFLNKVIENVRSSSPSYWTFRDGVKDSATGYLLPTPINVFELLDLASRATVIETGKSGVKIEGSMRMTNDLSARPGEIYVHKPFATRSREERIFSVIHEAFHQLERATDQEIARAAQIADGVKEKDLKIYDGSKEGGTNASIKFNDIVLRRCKGLSVSNSTTFRF